MKKIYIPLLVLLSFAFSFISCAEIPSDTENETTIPISTEHIHTEEILPAIPATCTEAGLSEGVRCAVCLEVLLAQEVTPAHGHHYEDSVCTVCGHKTTKGLTFFLNSNGDSYVVSGMGTATDTEICIPDTYNGLPVTSIGESAFSNCDNLTSIVIPNGVTSIGNAAFFYCRSLKSIELPNGLISIGIDAFSYCRSLKSIEIPSSVTKIDISAFEYCSGLKRIVIPSSMESIGGGVFAHCTDLTSIELPNGVTTIGVSAFSHCTNLKSIVLPESVTTIGYGAFSSCVGLTNIEIPSHVTEIGEYAFHNCVDLVSITFQGTKAQWNAITKGHGWNFNTDQYTVHCVDGEISK